MIRYTTMMRFLFGALAALLSGLQCTPGVSGSEVKNERVCLHLPGGAPAAGATVQVVPVAYVPGDASGMLYTTVTDGNGEYTVENIPSGLYNMYARKDSLVHFSDSIMVGTNSGLRNDTLGYPSNLLLRVNVQPNHDPRSVVVQVLGTSMYFENVDSSGLVKLSGLAAGRYRLRQTSTISGYTPTFVTVEIPAHAAQSDSVETVFLDEPVRLIYTGIPVVTGLTANFDPVTSTVRVEWDPVSYSDLYDYVIYRENPDSNGLSMQWMAKVTKPEFIDSIGDRTQYNGKTTLLYRYRVAVRNRSLQVGETYRFATVTIDPASRSVSLFTADTQSFSSGTPITLKIDPSVQISGKLRYFWAIGPGADFVETAVPETTFTIAIAGDSVVASLACRAKVENDRGSVLFDTLSLGSKFVWEKIAESPKPGSGGYSVIVAGDRMVLFCRGAQRTWQQAWSSVDGRQWQQLGTTLPFTGACSPPLWFNNRYWVLDRTAVDNRAIIWSSDSGTSWDSSTVALLSGKGYSADYEVWSTLNQKIVLVNYYPLCLRSGSCGPEPATCWTTADGTAWQTASLPNSLFPDRNDEPNRFFIGTESNGGLWVGGAWRTAYLVNPPGASYMFRIWSDAGAVPVELPFPRTGSASTFTEYYPAIAHTANRQFVSLAVPSDTTGVTELWTLQNDSTWYRCSDRCPVDTKDIHSDYHALQYVHETLFSISNAGVWRVKR
jgi:hypothetical protein